MKGTAMPMFKRSCVLVLAMLAASCSGSLPTPSAPSPVPQVAAPTFTLFGVISTARATGVVPLEGVQVSSGPQSVMTDGNGYYSMPGLTATSSIFVNKYPYKQERRSLSLSADTRLDLQLVRLDPYHLSGVVSELTPTGLMPIEGALVTGSFDYPTTTDANGFFKIPAVLYGGDDSYMNHLYIIKEGYRTYERDMPFTSDTQLEIQLVRR
jgi:hypothetical protein